MGKVFVMMRLGFGEPFHQKGMQYSTVRYMIKIDFLLNHVHLVRTDYATDFALCMLCCVAGSSELTPKPQLPLTALGGDRTSELFCRPMTPRHHTRGSSLVIKSRWKVAFDILCVIFTIK